MEMKDIPKCCVDSTGLLIDDVIDEVTRNVTHNPEEIVAALEKIRSANSELRNYGEELYALCASDRAEFTGQVESLESNLRVTVEERDAEQAYVILLRDTLEKAEAEVARLQEQLALTDGALDSALGNVQTVVNENIRLLKEIDTLTKELQEDRWKSAVDEALITTGSTVDTFNCPRAAIAALVDWYVATALDPAVSKAAQDLVGKGPTFTRYFVWDGESGYHEYATEEDRDRYHREAISYYKDVDDAWCEDVDCVRSGIVTHETAPTGLIKKPPVCDAHPNESDANCDMCMFHDEYPDHCYDYICSYEPAPLTQPGNP